MSRAVRLSVVAAGLLTVVGGETAAQAADSTTPTSIRAGAYTATQARAGEEIFRQVCSQCHVTGQFNDPNFLRSWGGRPVRDLFELIRTQMPQDSPGQLKREEYAAVLAYIFRLNGLPPGDLALPTDTTLLRRIRIEAKP